jgi:hypothetical protein
MGERPGGKWAAFEAALIVTRQNGKNAIIRARQLAGALAFGEREVVHTAHEMPTALKHMDALVEMIEATPSFDRKVKIVRTGEGRQAIEFLNGCQIMFKARTRSGARGFSGDVVYLDEAFDLPAAKVGALLPLMRTRPNPQVWYTSSAPHFSSAFLHSLLKRAETGVDEPRLYLAEWGNPADVRFDDPDGWYRSNPTLGIRVAVESMMNEYRTYRATPEGMAEFARELLGIREGGDGEPGVIDYATWSALADAGSRVVDRRQIGLAVSPDGLASAFGFAGRRADGTYHVETIKWAAGTGWVVDYARKLRDQYGVPLGVRPGGPESVFLKDLEEARIPVREVDDRAYARACGAMLVAVKNGTVHHRDQETLNRSVAAAGKRAMGVGDLWTWARPGAVDISPLVAATQAFAGVAGAGPTETVPLMAISR